MLLRGVAEREERVQREGRVADPRVAVVPVAFAADLLGKRGRRRCHDRAGRRVRQPLEHEPAPQHLLAVRALVAAPFRPSLPVTDRALELAEDPLARQPVWAQLVRKLPGERDQGVVTLLQGAGRIAGGDLRCPDRKLGLEDERIRAAVDDCHVFSDNLDPRLCEPVIEARLELGLHCDLAFEALHAANHPVVGMTLLDPNHHAVREEDHAVRGLEARLEDVRVRHVLPRDLVVAFRSDAEEAALAPVEDSREDGARLEAVERAPVDRAVLRD